MANGKAVAVVTLSILTIGGIATYLYIQYKEKEKEEEAKALADSLNKKNSTDSTTKTDTTKVNIAPTSTTTNQTKTIPNPTLKNQFFRIGDFINPTKDLGEQPIRVNTSKGWQVAANSDGSIKTTSISPSDRLKIVDFFDYNGVNYIVATTSWNKYPVAIKYFYAKLSPYQGS